MSSKVRIGFVGVGSMGQCAHLRNYVSVADCEVVAVAEPRPKLAQEVANRYGISSIYSNAESMVAAERLDGIVASQPFDRHGSVVLPLYRFGLPLFTEKPLASSIAIAEKMLSALKAGGSWHMVGYHKRCDPATTTAKEEIRRLQASGELGRLTYVRVTMPAGDWVASGFTDLIRSDEPVPAVPADPPAADMPAETFASYISFVNYYIHQVNLMRYLLGEPYGVTHADPTGVLLVARSQSGIPATLEMTPYRTTVDWQEEALVAFEKGYVRLRLPAPLALNRPGSVEFLRDPGEGVAPETVSPQLPWVRAMKRQAERFVMAINGKMAPPCEAAEALEDLRVADVYVRMLTS